MFYSYKKNSIQKNAFENILIENNFLKIYYEIQLLFRTNLRWLQTCRYILSSILKKNRKYEKYFCNFYIMHVHNKCMIGEKNYFLYVSF